MNDDLHAAAVEYSKWYTGRFGTALNHWYVFPFGKPVPTDPTRPQTSLRTAWRRVRAKAQVGARFHDTSHTFVTHLGENGAGDEVIRDMAGHVSKDMLKHYSHIRTEAKRRAVQSLAQKNSKARVGDSAARQPVETDLRDSYKSFRSTNRRDLQCVDFIGSSGRIRTYNPSVNSLGILIVWGFIGSYHEVSPVIESE